MNPSLEFRVTRENEWEVIPLNAGRAIGNIYWHGVKKQYVFRPYPYKIVDVSDLRQIENFLDTQTTVRIG